MTNAKKGTLAAGILALLCLVLPLLSYAILGARPERFFSFRKGVIQWDLRINPEPELGPN
jgi:hypothetical protein